MCQRGIIKIEIILISSSTLSIAQKCHENSYLHTFKEHEIRKGESQVDDDINRQANNSIPIS